MSRVTFIAGENINKGDAIALGSGYSIARKASATSSLYNSVIGFATHGAAAGSAVLVNRDTIFTSLSGLTPGQTSYVSYASGSVVSSYDGWYNSIPITSSGTVYLTSVGRNLSSSGISNQIEPAVAVNLDNIFVYFLLEDGSGYITTEDDGIISLER
jgi:hypothetical protein